MARYGFLAVKIPSEYGGAGADSLTYVMMIEELARVAPCCASYANTPNSLGGGPLMQAGNEAQKLEKICPPWPDGEKIGVRPDRAGRGLRCRRHGHHRRADGDDYILNGRKCFISGAPMADWAVVITPRPT